MRISYWSSDVCSSDLCARWLLSDLGSQRAQLESEIGATRLELLDLEEGARNEALTQVSTLQTQLLELEQQVGSAASTVGLHTLKAPLAGTVVNLQVFSEGTVVLAGEPLLDIVPDHDELVVEARVHPDDIENVAPGMPAKVRLTGLNVRTTPLLHGEVTLVSARSEEHTSELQSLMRTPYAV